MAKSSATLAIKIVSDASQAARELDKLGGKTGRTGKSMQIAGAAAAAGLGLLATGAMGAAQAAAQDAKGQAILAKALHNSAGATDAQVSSTEAWITAQGKALGVTDDQLRPALATLARATGDVGEAQKAASLAMDISAATGKDVVSVSKALAKGYAGNTGALGKLVPGIDKGVLATKDMHKVTAELARLTGGSAAAAADTAAGKQERMHVAMQETYESIGGALLPVLGILSGVLMTVSQWAQQNSTLFVILAGVLGVVAVAVLAVSAATKVYAAYTAVMTAANALATTSFWALAASILANPITWIVVGIVAFVAAIVIAYKKSDKFRAIVQAAFAAVASAARAVARVVGAVLTAVWPYIVAVAKPIIWAIATYLKLWWNAAKLVAHVLEVVLTAAFKVLKRVASPILDGLRKGFEVIKSVIDPVIDAVRTLLDMIGRIKIPKIHIPGIGKSAPTYAPSPSLVRASTSSSSSARRAASAAGRSLVVNVNAPLDPQQTARAVQRLTHSADVRGGRVRFA